MDWSGDYLRKILEIKKTGINQIERKKPTLPELRLKAVILQKLRRRRRNVSLRVPG